jgi:hypothetical protein
MIKLNQIRNENPIINKNQSTNQMKIFKSSRVILNIGGKRFDVRWKNFEKLPNSRLGRIRFAKSIEEIEDLCDEVNIDQNELYFDRPSNCFNPIIDYYRTGKLHITDSACIISFYDELNYWCIDDKFFEQCCNYKYLIYSFLF